MQMQQGPTMIDFHTPRFKTSDVAQAANIPAATLRSYFKRGHVPVGDLDKKQPDGEGLPNLFSLRDALQIAIAADLIAAGADAAKAFSAAIRFVHTGTEDRLPSHLFAKGTTWLMFRPKSGTVSLFNSGSTINADELMWPRVHRDPAILLNVNDTHNYVMDLLER